MVTRKNIHETSFLYSIPPEKCVVCNQTIFDFEELPADWKHKKCSLEHCQESIHVKCFDLHFESHPKTIDSILDIDQLRKTFGINKNLEVDRCIMCKRNLILKKQLCSDCSTIN